MWVIFKYQHLQRTPWSLQGRDSSQNFFWHWRQEDTRPLLKKVGRGLAIDIWEDNWLPLQNGYKVWSAKPANSKISLVYELLDHEKNCWNEQLVNSLFMPFEAAQILQIPLPDGFQNDMFSWGPHRKGYFTVKSAYQGLKKWEEADQNNCSNQSKYSSLWKKLWSLKTVPKTYFPRIPAL